MGKVLYYSDPWWTETWRLRHGAPGPRDQVANRFKEQSDSLWIAPIISIVTRYFSFVPTYPLTYTFAFLGLLALWTMSASCL